MTDREIIADYTQHVVGEREVVDWERLDAEGRVQTHRNVPLIYLREVTAEEYFERNPDMRGTFTQHDRCFFWEVSID